jgi:hypothetical protein
MAAMEIDAPGAQEGAGAEAEAPPPPPLAVSFLHIVRSAQAIHGIKHSEFSRYRFARAPLARAR